MTLSFRAKRGTCCPLKPPSLLSISTKRPPGKKLRADSSDLSVILPRGIHPFPSRTRKLSPAGPMVLHAPSVWERRSLPALIKASLRNQIGLFLLLRSFLTVLNSSRPHFPLRLTDQLQEDKDQEDKE